MRAKNIFKITAIIIFSIFVLSSFSFCLEDEDSISITTYYPSPYGVYKYLRVYPNDDSTPGTTCASEGEMYYDNSEQNLYICSNNTWKLVPGTGGSIPSGMIAMFDTTCPSGWSPVPELNNRFPLGGASYGVPGGSLTHKHTFTYSGTTERGSGYKYASGMSPVASTEHTHSYSGNGTTAAGGGLPPYLTVIYCKKD